jgi:hypothetical protein
MTPWHAPEARNKVPRDHDADIYSLAWFFALALPRG